jgi:hypothetical protein
MQEPFHVSSSNTFWKEAGKKVQMNIYSGNNLETWIWLSLGKEHKTAKLCDKKKNGF